ncbi:MAG: (Fe-S)-binding protein [Syntrophaceae bacterium]|nr:(Fe-S)-binding protein [Syntrophaceae bacterium]
MNHREITNIDYGFRLNGNPILFYKDRSLAADESTHQMEKALRQLSMEYYVFDRCLQCGICSSSCPFSMLKIDEHFSPRTFIQKTRLGLLDLDKEELWTCTNCGSCQMVCPFEIKLPEVMAQLRHLVVEQGAGHVPLSIKSSTSSIASCGNPWREETATRTKWLRENGITQDTSDNKKSIHIFLGCLAGYDRRAHKTAEAAMHILKIAGIHFKILADDEVCCGDTACRVGDFSTAKRVKKINEENFLRNNIEKLYVLSPHCFSTFKDLFSSKEMKNIKTAPLIELIHQLFRSRTIKVNGNIEKKVTFHDPCFFSKHLDIIDQPREILQEIPGIEFVEMEHYGKKSLCCGGGGGGIWRDVKKGERLSEVRLDEAIAVGAQIVVTNCPYCLSMLEDARQGDEKYKFLEIMDIFELIRKGMNYENN